MFLLWETDCIWKGSLASAAKGNKILYSNVSEYGSFLLAWGKSTWSWLIDHSIWQFSLLFQRWIYVVFSEVLKFTVVYLKSSLEQSCKKHLTQLTTPEYNLTGNLFFRQSLGKRSASSLAVPAKSFLDKGKRSNGHPKKLSIVSPREYYS